LEQTAQYALTGSVVASALGGITLSLLIVGYGFTSADDETPDSARRRLLLIRMLRLQSASQSRHSSAWSP